MTQMMKELNTGETIEISEAYIGHIQKLPTRVIIHRLTDDQTGSGAKIFKQLSFTFKILIY